MFFFFFFGLPKFGDGTAVGRAYREIRLLAAFRANGNDQGHIEHDDADVAVAVAVDVSAAVRVNCRCFCLTLEGAFYSCDLPVAVAVYLYLYLCCCIYSFRYACICVSSAVFVYLCVLCISTFSVFAFKRTICEFLLRLPHRIFIAIPFLPANLVPDLCLYAASPCLCLYLCLSVPFRASSPKK